MSLPEPGSDADPRLYGAVAGSRTFHIIPIGADGYDTGQALCGVTRNLDMRELPSPEFEFTVCAKCRTLERQQQSARDEAERRLTRLRDLRERNRMATADDGDLARAYRDANGDDAKRKAIEAEVDAMHSAEREAEKAFFFSVCMLKPRAGKREVVDSIWPSTYRSQGLGTVRYMRANAELRRKDWESCGVTVELRDVEQDRHDDITGKLARIDVVTHVDTELDEEIVRAQLLPLRERVRLSWKLGINPRVMMPFLPHGYEAREGLDFLGNDLRQSDSNR